MKLLQKTTLSALLLLAACGTNSNSTLQISSGKIADKNILWMASLTHSPDEAPFCGATLIGDDVALTAAHCVSNLEKPIFVTLGSTTVPEPKNSMPMKGVVVHPEFNLNTGEHNIALVWFNKPDFPLKALQTVSSNFDLSARTFKAFGWGSLTTLGTVQPHELQSVELKVVDNATCASQLKESILHTQLCATGIHEGMGQDTCRGDDGGPLVVENEGALQIYGVTSWRKSCGQVKTPGVYTAVSNYSSWIREQLEKASDEDDRASAFERSCFQKTELTDSNDYSQTVLFRVKGEFLVRTQFEKNSDCGDFEISTTENGRDVWVREKKSGLVALAEITERSFDWPCQNYALLYMNIKGKTVEGAIANSHSPFVITGEMKNPNLVEYKVNSTCSFFGESKIEILVSTWTGHPAARFRGPAFSEIDGKVFRATRPTSAPGTGNPGPNKTPLKAKKTGVDSVEILNKSDFVAHGIFLMCRLPFSVSPTGGGEAVKSRSLTGMWHGVGLNTPEHPWSRISAKNGKLALKLYGVSSDEFVAWCKVNNNESI